MELLGGHLVSAHRKLKWRTDALARIASLEAAGRRVRRTAVELAASGG